MQAAVARTIAGEVIDAAPALAARIPAISRPIALVRGNALRFTNYFNSLTKRKQLALAGKVGAYAEFGGERLYNMVKRSHLGSGRRRRRHRPYPKPRSNISTKVPYLKSIKPYQTRKNYNHRLCSRTGYTYATYNNPTLQPGVLITDSVLASIGRGDASGQRIGDRCFVTGVSVRCEINNSNTDVNGGGWMRFILTENKRPAENLDTALFAPNDNYNFPTAFGAGASYRRVTQMVNQQKHNVLKDVRYRIKARTADNSPNTTFVQFWVPINRWVQYNVSGTPALSMTPYFCLYAFCENNNNAAFTSALNISWFNRVSFKD